MPFKAKGTPHYQYDRTFTLGGQRYRVRGSTGETNKARAAEVEEHAVRAKKREILDGPVKAQITVSQAIGTYCSNISQHQPSWRTSQSQAKNLVAGLKGKTLLRDVDQAALSGYIAKRRAHVSNATVNREMQFFRRCIEHSCTVANAHKPDINWKALRYSEPKERVRALSHDEEARLFEHLRPDLHDFVRFALLSGARVASIIALKWDQVDFRARTITFAKVKGGGSHVIPITQNMLVFLANLPRAEGQYQDYVLTYIDQRRGVRRSITQAGWKKPWWAALKAAGIEDFRFHDLRHTAATRCGDIVTASALLGHSDISTTSRYFHRDLDDLRDALEERERGGWQKSARK